MTGEGRDSGIYDLKGVCFILQQQTPVKLPKWFSADLCRYYILLHDCVDGEDSKYVRNNHYGVLQAWFFTIVVFGYEKQWVELFAALPDQTSNVKKLFWKCQSMFQKYITFPVVCNSMGILSTWRIIDAP